MPTQERAPSPRAEVPPGRGPLLLGDAQRDRRLGVAGREDQVFVDAVAQSVDWLGRSVLPRCDRLAGAPAERLWSMSTIRHGMGALSSKARKPLDETLETLVIARDGEGLAAWPDTNVQPILRHIDSSKHIHLPSLHMRARDAAPATVRDVRMDGWGAMLANGLLYPRSKTTTRSLGDTRSPKGDVAIQESPRRPEQGGRSRSISGRIDGSAGGGGLEGLP